MSKLINLEDLNEFKEQMFNAIYPVGSVYMTNKSQSEFDPNSVWGGTWEKVQKYRHTIVIINTNIPGINTSISLINYSDTDLSFATLKDYLNSIHHSEDPRIPASGSMLTDNGTSGLKTVSSIVLHSNNQLNFGGITPDGTSADRYMINLDDYGTYRCIDFITKVVENHIEWKRTA